MVLVVVLVLGVGRTEVIAAAARVDLVDPVDRVD